MIKSIFPASYGYPSFLIRNQLFACFFFSYVRNCQKSVEMLRISNNGSILLDILIGMEFDRFSVLLEIARIRQKC